MNKFKDFFKSFLLWFAIFYVIVAGYEHFWGEKNKAPELAEGSIIIEPVSKSVIRGNLPWFKIENKLKEKIVFTSPCDTLGSLKVFRKVNDQNFDISSSLFSNCGDRKVDNFSLEPESSIQFALPDFDIDIFTEEGVYQLEMVFSVGEDQKIVSSAPLEVGNPGVFRQFFRAIVSKPLFNLLIFLTQILPNHSFGWSIVIMTFLVRLILFIPNQKAMRSQRELQKLQPKMEELKQKYGKNQQMMAMKTMELYKTHKINPMGSCLPMLFQMPFLIGVYYIVREGLSPHLSYLLYSFNEKLDLSVLDTQFFGLELTHKGPIILAVIVGFAQWFAIKLSFLRANKRQKKHVESENRPVEKKQTGPMNQMEQMNKMMLWIMPVMVASFVTSFPAGVGVYWFFSTIFGIGQQWLVNWQLDQPQVVRKEQ